MLMLNITWNAAITMKKISVSYITFASRNIGIKGVYNT